MQFGINFFPSVRPEQKSGEQYFDEALRLTVLADELGYSHVRTGEHYFRPYGGLSPSPIVFLTAAALREGEASGALASRSMMGAAIFTTAIDPIYVPWLLGVLVD